MLAPMKILAFIIALWVPGLASALAGVSGKQPLHVLYVGSTNAEGIGPSKTTPEGLAQLNAARAADFERFLGEHFERVTAVRAKDFTLALGRQADVIVADERISVWMPDDYRVPLIAVGQMGMQTLWMRGSKMDWLCACLDEKLHHVRTDHPIFRGPLAVVPTLVDEIDTTTRLPIRAWKVHAETPVPGMVTSLANLLDAADSEMIAGGVNMKGDHGIALAREANLFLWGPVAAPAEMTEEARKVFVNTIVYMRGFAGERPTVRRDVRARNSLKEIIESPYITRVAQFANYFPGDMVASFGTDKTKYQTHFEGKTDWVYVPPATLCFTVDEEARSLGVPNHDVRLLDRCVEGLGDASKRELAARVLARYTGLSFGTDVAAWKAWLTQHRDSLYFSDAYGYRFYSGPAGPGPVEAQVRQALHALESARTTEASPVAVSGALVGTSGGAYGRVGDRFTLAVRLRVHEGWHTYDSVPAGNPMRPTEVDVALPSGMRWAGDWHSSPPVPEMIDKKPTGVLQQTGEVIYLRSMYAFAPPVASAGSARGRGTIELKGTVAFQVCDDQRCLEAVSLPISVKLTLSAR